MKKRTTHVAQPKVYRPAADLIPLEKYGTFIIQQCRTYYRNRAVHLIGTGTRCIKKKGRSSSR